MAIRKPIFVMPLDLGTVVCGNAASGNPVFNLAEFLTPGLTWRSDGTTNLWARGQFDTAQAINFCAMLAANAQASTTIRLRLGGSQAEVDGTPLTPTVDSAGIATAATYTATSSFSGFGAALTSNGAGLRDGTINSGAAATSHATTAIAGQAIFIDFGASYAVETVELSNNVSFGAAFLNGAVLAGSNNGSTYTDIATIAGGSDGVLLSIPVGTSYRYLRLLGNANGLGVGEFRAKLLTGYDSGALTFINPGITREDGLYHSHLEIPATARSTWWRIDIAGHTGDFEASSLVLGKQIVPSRFYNIDYERGVEDLGEISFGRWAVPDETPGAILRTLGITLAWQTEAEFEANFRPMMEKLGKRGPVYCCFDPDPTTYRQGKTYLGVMRKPPFARGVPKPLTVTQEFDILSLY